MAAEAAPAPERIDSRRVIDGGLTRMVRSGERIELSLFEAGDPERPTLVFIHGYPDTKEMWQAVMAELAESFHVAAYDVRGAGASSAPRGPAAYDLGRLADDFEAVLDSVAPGKQVHLVGHDWGAIQGWEFATLERFRHRLKSFTAIACPSLDQVTSGGRSLALRPTPGQLLQLMGRLRRSWYVLMLLAPGGPTIAWRGVLGRGRWQWVLRNVERIPPGRASAPTVAADGLHGANLYRRNIPRRLISPRTDAVAHVPVQLIVPSRDHFVSPSYYSLAEHVAPVLRRRTIATTHWAPQIEPVRIARWLEELVGDVESGVPLRSRRQWVRGGGIEQLRGRAALVTGAASGIGFATARALSERGGRLLLVDRDGDSLERAAASIPGSYTFVCDVSDEEAMERLLNDVLGEHGVPDVVVNNAGIGVAGPFMATGVEDWRRIVGVNLMGVVHGCRLFGGAMIARGEGGQIINTASAAAFAPTKDLAAYSATKAAVLMLSECLRAEMAPHGIGVSAICPGFIATGITRAATYVGRSDDEAQDIAERVTRLYERRNFTPDRVATEIVETIATDRPVAAVTPEARLMRALSRVAPGVLRRIAQLDALPA